MTSSNPDYLQRPHLQKPSYWELGFQPPTNFGGDTNIQFIRMPDLGPLNRIEKNSKKKFA